MDIQSLSTGMAQSKVLEEASIRVGVMALGNAKADGEAVMKLLETAAVVTTPEVAPEGIADSSVGNNINILA